MNKEDRKYAEDIESRVNKKHLPHRFENETILDYHNFISFKVPPQFGTRSQKPWANIRYTANFQVKYRKPDKILHIQIEGPKEQQSIGNVQYLRDSVYAGEAASTENKIHLLRLLFDDKVKKIWRRMLP